MRIPKHNRFGHTASGYFDSPEALAEATARWDGRANIYLTLNPVDPALLARASNRIVERAEHTTADRDIIRRDWLFIDVDPVRPSGISATDAEVERARSRGSAIIDLLTAEGWPDPVLVMSGNGANALYRVDLRNDAESLALTKAVLEVLAARFSDGRVKVDTSVANAARIIGVAGTLKMKGENLPDRPHRRSRLERVPDRVQVVPLDLLRQLAATAAPEARGTTAPQGRGRLATMLEAAGIEYREQPPDAAGLVWYHVGECPFHGDEGRPFECGVGEGPDGRFAGKCFHDRGKGKGWREWKAALGLDSGRGRAAATPKAGSSHKPAIVITNRHLHEIAADGWDAIQLANKPPRLFAQGSEIAEVRVGDEGRHHIAHLTLAGVKGRVDRAATWLKLSDGDLLPARPPRDVIEDMIALEKPLPVIRGIAGAPTFAPDGSLSTEPGYQPNTRLFYVPSGEPVPCVPTEPDTTDLIRAKQIIGLEWLPDFPFVDDASRAHAIAAALTAFAREMIDGPTPLFGIDAPTPATGKGLLAASIGIIAAGAPPAVMTETRSEEEFRKRITAILSAGTPVNLLDNVKHRLESGTFAGLLTSTVWADRILGKTQTIELPNRAVWLATGNNIQMDVEIGRRTVWVRLDSKVDRPWQRTGFRHPNLLAWAQRHRHELVWAFLVLVRNWLAKGRPAWEGTPLGSFETWSAVIGGILQAAGIQGFLSNTDERYERADAETEEWRSFTQSWWHERGEEPIKVADIMPLALELLPTVFENARDGATERALRTRLGKALGQRRDRRYGDLFVRQAGEDSHNGGTLWKLEIASPADDRADVGAGKSASSAQHPQGFDPFLDSAAEDADVADVDLGLLVNGPRSSSSDRETGGGGKRHPHLPQLPQTDSGTPDLGADVMRKIAPDPADVPRCRLCRLLLSVVATSDVCGRCRLLSLGRTP